MRSNEKYSGIFNFVFNKYHSMSNHRIFPDGNNNFNEYLQIVAPYLNANSARLKVSSANLTKLNDLKKQWDEIFPLTAAKTSGTHTLRTSRDELKIDLKKLLKSVYLDVPRSLLSQTDRDTFNMKARSSSLVRSTATDYAPSPSVEKIIHGLHTLRIKNPADPSLRRMPKGQKIFLAWCIVPAGNNIPAEANLVFTHFKNVTRHLVNIHFNESDTGSTAFYTCCYENTRGERGPMSAIIKAVIA
jgi:hypothetical protein